MTDQPDVVYDPLRARENDFLRKGRMRASMLADALRDYELAVIDCQKRLAHLTIMRDLIRAELAVEPSHADETPQVTP